MQEDDIIKANSDFLVTESTLDPKVPVDKVVSVLRALKITGQLVFHLSQGGVQKVALVEKTKAEDGERERIRKAIGV
jgi:hypothetical protein